MPVVDDVVIRTEQLTKVYPGGLKAVDELDLFHEAYGSHDTMLVFAGATDLTDADIVLGEGRQIVFVEPAAARKLDLGTSAARVVPAFLDSELYRKLSG